MVPIRWYLHRMNACYALTVERADDARGFTRMWPQRLAIDARLRKAMRVALADMTDMVQRIDRAPAPGPVYDPLEVEAHDG